jgi:hypothetical protein
MKHPCPHCGAPTVPLWKKVLFGPAISVRCEACGKWWATSYWNLVVAGVAVGGYYLFVKAFHPSPVLAGVGIAAAMIAVTCGLAAMPLARK